MTRLGDFVLSSVPSTENLAEKWVLANVPKVVGASNHYEDKDA
jgi:hypothetical protein